MIRNALLALGLLLSMMSQLRVIMPLLGPGEYCLAIWLALTLGREAGRLGPALTPALTKLLIFWLLFALAQSLGALTGLALADENDPQGFAHDIIAYALAAVVSCLSVAEADAGPRLRRVAWILSALGAAGFALQLANGQGLFSIPKIDPWYWDRFRGWSANPNQLALLCAVLGLIALYLADSAASLGERVAALGCMVFAAFVGLLTKSNSFTLVLLAAGPVFIALKLGTWLFLSERRVSFKFAAAWLIVLALPLALAAAAPLGSALTLEAGNLGRHKTEGTTQEAELRFHLWREAIRRGVESGLLGLGPGPHSELPHSIEMSESSDEPINTQKAKSWSNFESHNTLLEIFTQGGLFAVSSFIWIIGMAVLAAQRARQGALITLLCGVGIFSIFHVIIRHPMSWFVVALCLVAEPKRASTVQEMGR
jgi:hypothetical protein